MARKKRKSPARSASSKAANSHHGFLQHRLQEGMILIVLAAAAFIFLALITYHAGDPSWSNLVSSAHVQNSAGRAGAWFADLLLYLCGDLSYLLPVLLIYNAWQRFERRRDRAEISPFRAVMISLRVFGFVLILGAGSGLASLSFAAGGIIGNLIATTMIKSFNLAGAGLILMTFFLIGVTLFTGLSWIKSSERVGSLVLMAGRACLSKRSMPVRPKSVEETPKFTVEAPVQKIPAVIKVETPPVDKPLRLNRSNRRLRWPRNQKKFLKTCGALPGTPKLPSHYLIWLSSILTITEKNPR